MSVRYPFQPPRTACWLLDLFTPYEEAESIPGDLDEEFCAVAEERGIRAAQRWYWRQTCRSVAHLIAAALRTSPWSLVSTVLAGVFLLRLGAPLPERLEFAILNWGHLYHSHWYAYVSRMGGSEILAGQLLVGLVAGFAVGLLAKGRELVAALLLILVMQLLLVVIVQSSRVVGPAMLLWHFLIYLSGVSIMILLGAWIIRDIRLGRLRSQV
jgi:hypothetical protein